MSNWDVTYEFKSHRYMTVEERDPDLPRRSPAVPFQIEGDVFVVSFPRPSAEAAWILANGRVRIRPCDATGLQTGEDAAAVARLRSLVHEIEGDEPSCDVWFEIEPLIFDRDKHYEEYLDWKMAGRPTSRSLASAHPFDILPHLPRTFAHTGTDACSSISTRTRALTLGTPTSRPMT